MVDTTLAGNALPVGLPTSLYSTPLHQVRKGPSTVQERAFGNDAGSHTSCEGGGGISGLLGVQKLREISSIDRPLPLLFKQCPHYRHAYSIALISRPSIGPSASSILFYEVAQMPCLDTIWPC